MTTKRNLNEALEICERLRASGTREQQDRVARRGIPEQFILGAAKPAIQREAKRIGTDQALAGQLWATTFHEARLLAVLVADPQVITRDTCRTWISDLRSWDLTDQLARYLLPHLPDPWPIIMECVAANPLYARRLGFAGIACMAMKQPASVSANTDSCLAAIESAASDTRHHVRKAVTWALVEIGKIDSAHQEAAILTASELVAAGRPMAVTGRAAQRELEQLTQVPERRRLISRTSKTGRKQQEQES